MDNIIKWKGTVVIAGAIAAFLGLIPLIITGGSTWATYPDQHLQLILAYLIPFIIVTLLASIAFWIFVKIGNSIIIAVLYPITLLFIAPLASFMLYWICGSQLGLPFSLLGGEGFGGG